MNDIQEYIEAYFTHQLNDQEKAIFEQRCVEDKTFAGEVALYITTREGIRQKLLEEKKQQWGGKEQNNHSRGVAPLRKILSLQWMPYLAAACLLFAVALFFFRRSDTPHELADRYIEAHLVQLSQTMDASNDSLQQGIAAYNKKDYNRALPFFERIYQSHPENYTAKKYTGLVYLMTGEYDKAILHFDELAQKRELYINPGLFLKAVALLKRSQQGDEREAKQILEQVVREKTEGSREAEKWLKEW